MDDGDLAKPPFVCGPLVRGASLPSTREEENASTEACAHGLGTDLRSVRVGAFRGTEGRATLGGRQMNIAIVFAGGSGVRMGAKIPKQFIEINGQPVLLHTLFLFERHPLVDAIYLVVSEDNVERVARMCRENGVRKLRRIVEGGASAQDSIYNGLRAAAAENPPETTVLLHDGVRPYVDENVITANIRAVETSGNAITYTPCYETIVLSGDGHRVDAIPYRRESYTAQAPQSFRLGDIIEAHERIRDRPEGYRDMIDQATICHALGIPVNLVPGNRGNIKITTPEDVYILQALFRYREDKGNGHTLIDF